MSQSLKLDAGGHRTGTAARVPRDQPVRFRFDGRSLVGYAGETVAASLLAHGIHLVGRSFKYHRPRGILSAGVEEPNALLTVGQGASQEPNLAATVLETEEGLITRTQNAWPSVGFDLMAVNSWVSPLLVAGFYYKTFMGPTRRAWMFYEHFIRRAAGLGATSEEPDPQRYDWHHRFADLLVIGAGPAGLMAALAGAACGADVLLVEQDTELGGSVLSQPVNSPEAQWLADTTARVKATGRIRVLTRSTAFGLFDGNTVGVVERSAPGVADTSLGIPRQRLHLVRAKALVMACGAIERPLVFAGNDRPGVMLSGAIGSYVNRFGVLPGRQAVIATNNDAAYGDAVALARAGARVQVADLRAEVKPALRALAAEAGVVVHPAMALTHARGAKRVSACTLTPLDPNTGRLNGPGLEVTVDLIGMSGGWTPTVHLSSHRGRRPVYQDAIQSFVPGGFDRGQDGAGSMVGCQTLGAAMTSGWQAALRVLDATGQPSEVATMPWIVGDDHGADLAFRASMLQTGDALPDKAFVDFQHDVTSADIDLAHREGYVSVEHLKRYTTLGMGTDQGKTSGLNGLVALANARGQTVPEVGTTTFRPPYTPVTLGMLAGRSVRSHLQPERRTAMHDWHTAHGSVRVEAGLWLRPLWYRSHGRTLGEAYKTEMALVRDGVGIADVSTLGKIDVQGPDAAAFLDRVYVNGFSKLAVGKARYGFMLREDGIVMDDGTTSRISDTCFFMTTTTGQAGRVMSHLEFLLQVVWPELRVTVASVTDQWAAMSVAGPRSRDVLQA
ncbi:MAG: FAD-dependent oxidoreductase, partial [Rhodoferax sp.]|nr:FAD-dependent oxidoreductase [Rhodoferax sp.]